MGLEDRIVLNSQILTGKPIIKGTRISVEFLLDLLSQGWSYEQIIQNYPPLTTDDILAGINFSRRIIRHIRVF